jgi:uncharacterized protein
MPTRTIAPVGAPCWADLMTSDLAGATAFYTGLFGWTAQDPNPQLGNYVNFHHNDVRVAGCFPAMPGAPVTDVWSVYLATEDAEQLVAAAGEHGGATVVPAMAVADLGSMAVVSGPDGGVIGAWQPGSHAGFGILGETGTPRWFELHTLDYAAAVPFYRDVFGWEPKVISDTDDFRMVAITDDEDTNLAGIADAAGHQPEGMPSHWEIYFGSDDIDRSVARATELGGTILRAPYETPYGHIATTADPYGGAFKLVA